MLQNLPLVPSQVHSVQYGRNMLENGMPKNDIRFYDDSDLRNYREGKTTRGQLYKKVHGRLEKLKRLGVFAGFTTPTGFTDAFERFMDTYADKSRNYFADDFTTALTAASAPVPVQWLQTWPPGIIKSMTAALQADLLLGALVVGKWSDAQIVTLFVEPFATTNIYGDDTNPPSADWNPQFNVRSIVRFEGSVRVSPLELQQAAEIKIDSAAIKRKAVQKEFRIRLNQVALTGFNNGANQTYGMLNDVNLAAYITLPNGVSGHPQWADKTFLEILADFQLLETTLRENLLSNVNPDTIQLTVAIPTGVVAYLKTTTMYGISVYQQLAIWYKKLRIIDLPEFTDASGGLNAVYFYAERLTEEEGDDSTDGGAVITQMIQSRFQVTGVAKYEKATVEAYSCATSGTLTKRPLAVVRALGV